MSIALLGGAANVLGEMKDDGITNIRPAAIPKNIESRVNLFLTIPSNGWLAS